MYSGHGHQCLANSAIAALKSLAQNIRNWSKSTLDEILDQGDSLYMKINKTEC